MDPTVPAQNQQTVTQPQVQPATQMPVQPSQATPQPIQQPVQPSKKKSSAGNVLFGIIVIFLIIAAAAGGYFLANMKKEKSVSVNLQNTPPVQHNQAMLITPTSTPVSTQSGVMDTSSWKTYRTNGYSIQYPNTWLIMQTDNIFPGSHNAIWIFNPLTMKDENGNGGNTGRQIPSQFVRIDQTISTQTPQQYINSVTANNPLYTQSSMDVKSITIGGLSGQSYMEQGEGSRGRIYVVSNKSALFLFNPSVTDLSSDVVLNAIVSSFSNK